MQLRDYQQQLKNDIYTAWESGHKNVCAVLPCGGGKTATFANIVRENKGAAVVIAHRNELVTQMSVALGREGVVHGIIAPDKTIKQICKEHVRELGTVMFDGNSNVKVAGVNTLIRRTSELNQWSNQVTLWVLDECQHLLRDNTWGKGVSMFPNAKGLGVTATPIRSDGKGLGRHADGVLDVLVEGPPMRELINRGYLSDYRIFGPPSDLRLNDVGIAADGDYKKPALKKAVQESHIVGDVVTHYLKIARNKLGITFTTDVETAGDVAAQFNANGVRAEVLSAKTPGDVRAGIINKFRNREILQLVNCDILGEGFDLGGGATVEVVSMARPTQSYGLLVQQFGRGIRAGSGKTHGIIIDHCQNILRHGLPDRERSWSLDAKDKASKSKELDNTPILRYCIECTQPYEKVFTVCPHCGTKHIPSNRSKPEFVDGVLSELSPEVLAQMRGDIARIDEDPLRVIERMKYAGATPVVINSAAKSHRLRQESQVHLREGISQWAGVLHRQGMSDSEIHGRFWFAFNIDVMTAQTLGSKEAKELLTRIKTNG